MKKFIIKLVLFLFLLIIIGEFIVRFYRLTPDIPQRFVDETGIQRYLPNQKGYYTKSDNEWSVNKYGWLGVFDLKNDFKIGIIGDSYIENIMNPLECNQGSLLKKKFPKMSFIEAGRSGVSFIEAMEISKLLDTTFNINYNLVYVSSNDFYESLSNRKRYYDRVQIDVENQKILKSKLKSPLLKKVLYNFKVMYYLYLRFPVFVDNQNINIIQHDSGKKEVPFDENSFIRLFDFCKENYKVEKIILVFHPGINEKIVRLAIENKFKVIELDSSGDSTWSLGAHDGHWSCYGHKRVSEQVEKKIKSIL